MNHAQDNYQHVYRLKNKSKINLVRWPSLKCKKKHTLNLSLIVLYWYLYNTIELSV